jgi:predicted 3-demethylubiquinone-9 3-methyltransferase (glyoxalase superfamily)
MNASTPKEAVMPKSITPFLWFDNQAEEAAEHYCSIFPDSRILDVLRTPGSETVLTVDFELEGQRFTAINGGPQFSFDEAVSFVVECADQAEVDRYWERLTDGGEEGSCGWCKDRYGLSWQVVPAGMVDLFRDEDRERARRAIEAMYGMRKLDIAAVRAAAEGVAA